MDSQILFVHSSVDGHVVVSTFLPSWIMYLGTCVGQQLSFKLFKPDIWGHVWLEDVEQPTSLPPLLYGTGQVQISGLS